MPRIMRRGMTTAPPPPARPTRTRNAASCSWPTAPTQPSSSRSSSAGWPAPTPGSYADQPDPLMAVVDPRRPAQPALHLRARRRAHAMDLGPQPAVTLGGAATSLCPPSPRCATCPPWPSCPCLWRAPSPRPSARRRWTTRRLAALARRPKHPRRRLGLGARSNRRRGAHPVRRARGRARGRLPGAAQQPRPLLRQDYGTRMVASLGPGYLGMDDDDGPPSKPRHQRRHRADPRRPGLRRDLRPRRPVVSRASAGWRTRCSPPPPAPANPARLRAPLARRAGGPVHRLVWPARQPAPLGHQYHPPSGPRPRCPADLLPVSRYVFSPKPLRARGQTGQRAGQAYLQAVEAWLATSKPAEGTLGRAIVDATAAVQAARPIPWPPPTPASCSASAHGAPTCSPCWAPGSPEQALGDPATVAGGPAPALRARRRAPAPGHAAHPQPAPHALPGLPPRRADHRLGTVDIKAGDTVIAALGSATQTNPALHPSPSAATA